MSKKTKDKESRICFALKPRQSLFVYRIQSNAKTFTEEELFKEKGEWVIEQKKKKAKRRVLSALVPAVKKGPTPSIR